MARWKFWLLGIAVVIVDYAVYAVLSLMLMSYDDSHNGTEPDYYKWSSYKPLDKAAVIGLWFWNIVNILFWGYVVYRVIRKISGRTRKPKIRGLSQST